MTTATNPDPYATRRAIATAAIIAGVLLVIGAWFVHQNAQDAYEQDSGVADAGRMIYGYNAFVEKPDPTVPLGIAIAGTLAALIGFTALIAAPPRVVDITPPATGIDG